ncbi:hypothetical protein [Mycobacteroides immunogenum]|uniref:hypothetical protein n=1 Tax=Mycobacteroides immunogenum TaxID=83262 RepID=UPI0006968C9F|nr:hypothetical protein [Mycobacteroides immunogenum]ANO05754.1 hypothetical protein BAB75_22580 [Mycobacteroides immunogenum]MCV7304025.1 hypothetical protein [Mycobacteroides immunogenum]WJR33011.1 hypothetical protein P3F83_21395 [Mycobacteroides immunogenum]
MYYVFIAIVLGALLYAGWRISQSIPARPQTRVTGPDDDPEFLWRIGKDNPSGH